MWKNSVSTETHPPDAESIFMKEKDTAEKIHIVSSHNEVLLPWTDFRLKQQDTVPLPVLVLDHHTDVMPAFRDAGAVIEKDCWKDPAFMEETVKKLKHDEHFHFAVVSGLVKECRISACVNGTVPAHEALQILWDERWEDENRVFADPEKYRFLADSVLETTYLEARFGKDLPEKFILDIDCDYFATMKSLTPDDRNYFDKMVASASLITVSLEKEWVRLLRFPGENHLTAEKIVETLFPCLNRK